MKKKFPFTFVALILIFTSCLKDDIVAEQEDLTNAEMMKQLTIEDPAIWNSLATQAIDVRSFESSALKSATKVTEYPGNNKFYFAIFEDLYPSEGDYDFNDVMLRSTLTMDKTGNELAGTISTTLINKGGSLPVQIGLMFYKNNGKKYTRIANENITINGVVLPEDGEPWLTDLKSLGDKWEIEYKIDQKLNFAWISYFIKTEKGGEILSSGFAPTNVTEEFTIPQLDFLSGNNLPWGLEIEAESFDIPNEKDLFLNCYPKFKEWAESNGKTNQSWFKHPDPNSTTPYLDAKVEEN